MSNTRRMVVRVLVRDPNDRCDSTEVGDSYHLSHGLEVENRMLHIDECSVKTGAGDDLNDRRVGESHMADKGQTSLTHHLLDPVGFHETLPV